MKSLRVRPAGDAVFLCTGKQIIFYVLTVSLMALATCAPAATFYTTNVLVSDVPGVAPITDTNLAGAWGIAHTATGPWWVNSTMGGVSLLLNGAGQPYPTSNPVIVTIPPVPSKVTGVVFNGDGGFNIASNLPATFIFVTLNGGISGWNAGLSNRDLAVLMVTNGPTTSYTGLTIAPRHGTNALYVANFGENRIEVFDQDYDPVTLAAGAFTDADVPAGLAVFNVQLISSNLLFVTYAPTNVFGGGAVSGAGFVSVYSTDGILVGELKHGPWMNAPWAVIPGPISQNAYGQNYNSVLVGMFGNGEIARFDADRGQFHDLLQSTNGHPIVFGTGLWGLGFGNGANAGPTNILYYSADLVTTNGFHGIFGFLAPVHAPFGDNDDQNSDDNDADDNNQ